MKKNYFTKAACSSCLVASSFLLMLTLPYCSSNAEPEDTKVVATEHNDAKFSNAKEADAKFLVNAAEINLEEIQLGELVETKSMIPEIKDLGTTMVTGHTKALKDLQNLADGKQISLPTSITNNGQDAYKKMMNEKGNRFDKAYCDMMVNSHKDAIDKFEKASKDAYDSDIRVWAASMLPALRIHLDRAITCQKMFGK